MITTRLTRNAPKVREILKDVLEADVDPDMTRTAWLAVVADDHAVGLVSSSVVALRESRVQVFLPPRLWKEKALVRAVRDGMEALFLGPCIKLTMSFPETWIDALSLSARLGFQREGLNKASFIDEDGRLVDQLYMGRPKNVQAAVGDYRAAPVADSVARGVAGDAEGAGLPRHPDVPA